MKALDVRGRITKDGRNGRRRVKGEKRFARTVKKVIGAESVQRAGRGVQGKREYFQGQRKGALDLSAD